MAQSVCFLKSFIGQCCRVLGEAAMALSAKFGHIAKLYRHCAVRVAAGVNRLLWIVMFSRHFINCWDFAGFCTL